jgi:D-arabinose 1-dehydrogenase-like Zn-dependent alcohol dehydrogenase
MTGGTVLGKQRFTILCFCCVTEGKTQENNCTERNRFGYTSECHIHNLLFFVWKNTMNGYKNRVVVPQKINVKKNFLPLPGKGFRE